MKSRVGVKLKYLQFVETSSIPPYIIMRVSYSAFTCPAWRSSAASCGRSSRRSWNAPRPCCSPPPQPTPPQKIGNYLSSSRKIKDYTWWPWYSAANFCLLCLDCSTACRICLGQAGTWQNWHSRLVNWLYSQIKVNESLLHSTMVTLYNPLVELKMGRGQLHGQVST